MSKLIASLKNTIVSHKTKKLNEAVSKRLINAMLSKFREQTEDDEKTITKYIQIFDRIKQSLIPQERDITKYDYEELKTLIDSRIQRQKRKKEQDNILETYMSTEGLGKGSNIEDVKQDLKKYFEIKEYLPTKLQNVLNIPYSKLNQFISQNFEKIFSENTLKKFLDENDDLSEEQILARIERYVNSYNLVPKYTKPVSDMTFDEFELEADRLPYKGEEDFSVINLDDTEVVYEDDDLLVFYPDEKQKCINIRKKYAPDRGWCTSWEGAGNYYYNYRLKNNLTLYYVINKNLDISNVDFASVILVGPYGDLRLADGSNSGRYAGGTVIPWNEIVEKIPVLKGKKELFVAKPLSDEEIEEMNKIGNFRVQTDPVKELGSYEKAELWVELLRNDLSYSKNGEVIYSNLPIELQKKYIGLGNDLTSEMIKNSSDEVIKYFLIKKRENLISKSLNQLNMPDITLLKTNEMKSVLNKNKERYFKESGIENSNSVEVTFNSNGTLDSNAKLVELYGLDEFFNKIDPNVKSIVMVSFLEEPIIFKIPKSIGNFKQLFAVSFKNCIDELPDEISNCVRLHYLALPDNTNLKTLPESIADKVGDQYKMNELMLINVKNTSPNFKISEKIEQFIEESNITLLIE